MGTDYLQTFGISLASDRLFFHIAGFPFDRFIVVCQQYLRRRKDARVVSWLSNALL
jgi:hypothetical protein